MLNWERRYTDNNNDYDHCNFVNFLWLDFYVGVWVEIKIHEVVTVLYAVINYFANEYVLVFR